MIRFAMLGGLVLALCAAVSAQDKKEVPKEPPKEVPKDLTKDLAPFQGHWKVTEAIADGKPAPKEALAELQFAFEGEKLTITEKSKAEVGSYSVDPKKEPATIDLVNPKGDKAVGIYKFDKEGKFTICFNKGKGAERPKNFDEKEAVTLVLEKVKK
jgi:uncharacterized protein (TIGR03067 family)